MKESFVENEFVKLWIEDGVIIEIFKPEIREVTLLAAKTIVEDRLKVSNGVERPLLVNMGNARMIEKSAREYFANEISISYISASAILLNSYSAWLAGKLFLAFNKPALRTELFKSEQKALEWLKQFVEK